METGYFTEYCPHHDRILHEMWCWLLSSLGHSPVHFWLSDHGWSKTQPCWKLSLSCWFRWRHLSPPSVSWAWLGSAAVCRLSSGYTSDSFVVAVSVVSRVRILVAFSVGGGWLARRGAVLLVCAVALLPRGGVLLWLPRRLLVSVPSLKGIHRVGVEFGWNVPLSGEVVGVTLVDPDSGCLLWWGSIKLSAAVAVETTKEIMFPLYLRASKLNWNERLQSGWTLSQII